LKRVKQRRMGGLTKYVNDDGIEPPTGSHTWLWRKRRKKGVLLTGKEGSRRKFCFYSKAPARGKGSSGGGSKGMFRAESVRNISLDERGRGGTQ